MRQRKDMRFRARSARCRAQRVCAHLQKYGLQPLPSRRQVGDDVQWNGCNKFSTLSFIPSYVSPSSCCFCCFSHLTYKCSSHMSMCCRVAAVFFFRANEIFCGVTVPLHFFLRRLSKSCNNSSRCRGDPKANGIMFSSSVELHTY